MDDENIEEAVGCFEHYCSGMGDENDAKQARIELDALQADRERYRWWEKNLHRVHCITDGELPWYISGHCGFYAMIDEAIDAAMKETPDDS